MEELISIKTEYRKKEFRIGITTDNHLGYKFQDPIRGEDSFSSFEEALRIAKENEVDFMILGGDLFHEKMPSHIVIDKCMDILKRHVYGSKQIEFKFFGDFNPNFCLEDVNIEMPIFLIHGNHDCPVTDFGKFSCINTLHTSNFLNYFGKQRDLNKITVKPLLFAKGGTFIALYGMGYLKDVRLKSLLLEGLVHFEFPFDKDEEDKYVKILVIHQNRPQKEKAAVNIDPKLFPCEFDLIIWGHEHESTPNLIPFKNGYIYQPGSTVATSLIDAEGKEKHVGILSINEKNMELTPIFLKEARLMYCDKINLMQMPIDLETSISNEDFLIQYINEVIAKLDQKYIAEGKTYDKAYKSLRKPLHLIRIKVEYNSNCRLKAKALENILMGRVANEK